MKTDLAAWLCPRCNKDIELGEEAWQGLPPNPGSPAVCHACGTPLEVNPALAAPTDLAWLVGQTARHEFRGERAPRLRHAPFTIAAGDRVFAAATDGKKLIAVEVDLRTRAAPFGYLEGSDERGVPEAIAWMKARLAETPTGARSSLAALRAWAGTDGAPCAHCGDTGELACGDCEGSGESERECERCDRLHECHCRRCDGTGRRDCVCVAKPHDQGRVLGVRIDRERLRRTLNAPLAEGIVLVATGDAHGGRLLRLFGERWTAILMGVEDSDRLKLPVFELGAGDAS